MMYYIYYESLIEFELAPIFPYSYFSILVNILPRNIVKKIFSVLVLFIVTTIDRIPNNSMVTGYFTPCEVISVVT